MTNLTYLETFIAVVDAGGFSAAARTLDMPRSTVSLHVKALESSLGTRLLKRSTRSVSLTEDGEALFEKARQGLENLHGALNSIRATHQQMAGLIRITAPADFPTDYLTRAIAEFRDAHPMVRFDLILSNASLGLVANNIDIAVGLSQRSDGDRVQRVLTPIAWGFFASSGWLERNDAPGSIDEISEFISPTPELTRLLETLALGGKKLPKGIIVADNQLLTRDLVLQGVGIGLLPVGLVEVQYEKGEVHLLLPNAMVGEPLLTIEFPSRADIVPRVKKFADHFVSLFR